MGRTEAVLTKETLPSTPEFTMELDAKDLPAGPYLLKLRAVRSKGGTTISQYPPYRILEITAAERARFGTYIDDDNVLILEGKRTFALGIYNTGGYSGTPGAYKKLFSKLSEAPLNLYINYWLGRAPNRPLSVMTSELRQHGMYYLHTVNTWYEGANGWPGFPPCEKEGSAQTLGEENYARCRAGELGSLPGLAGWYTADERPASQVGRVFRQYRALRTTDPDGIAFIAQNKMSELRRWRDATDVIGIDPYPLYNIPQGQLGPLEKVLDWVDAAGKSVDGSRPVWAVIQYFQFGSKGHWPTYDELRTMSYMAIVDGAKGLFYWSYGAKGLAWVKDPTLKEELWQRLVNVTKEIKSLEPVLLQDDAPEILSTAPSSTSIRVLAKNHEGARFVIAVNTGPQEISSQFQLSQPVGSVSVVGEARTISRESSLSFRDSFGPYAVHIYRISPTLEQAQSHARY